MRTASRGDSRGLGGEAPVGTVAPSLVAIALEFAAPVGLLESLADASGASWADWVEGHSVPWPSATRAAEAVRDAGVRAGEATLWSPEPDADHHWLILPIEAMAGSGPAVARSAWVGFARRGGSDGENSRWGPSAPGPALLAWGREVAARFTSRGRLDPGVVGQTSATTPNRLRLPAQLTRDLNVSDPPDRYQQTAVESLRDVLRAEAVVWVPRSGREPTVIAGAIPGLAKDKYRLLLSDRAGPSGPGVATLTPVPPSIRDGLVVSTHAEGGVGWLAVINSPDSTPFDDEAADLLHPVASLIAAQRLNSRHYAELKDLLFGIIRSLTSAIDAKDPYTLGHSERVGRIAVELGTRLGLSANERGDLYLAGLLHDVGKIGVSDAILQKPGALTPEETLEIRSHVRIGVQILSDLKKLHHLLPAVAHHHENFDGTGYPDGLGGASIPRIARVLAVADAFDAMSSTRPYRRKLAVEQIDQIFRAGSGVQWDPEVVEALFDCHARIDQIRQKGLGNSVMRVIDDTVGRVDEVAERSTRSPMAAIHP